MRAVRVRALFKSRSAPARADGDGPPDCRARRVEERLAGEERARLQVGLATGALSCTNR
jgi:hypothetical protein